MYEAKSQENVVLATKTQHLATEKKDQLLTKNSHKNRLLIVTYTRNLFKSMSSLIIGE